MIERKSLPARKNGLQHKKGHKSQKKARLIKAAWRKGKHPVRRERTKKKKGSIQILNGGHDNKKTTKKKKNPIRGSSFAPNPKVRPLELSTPFS